MYPWLLIFTFLDVSVVVFKISVVFIFGLFKVGFLGSFKILTNSCTFLSLSFNSLAICVTSTSLRTIVLDLLVEGMLKPNVFSINPTNKSEN